MKSLRLALAAALIASVVSAQSAEPEHWVSTWATSVVATNVPTVATTAPTAAAVGTPAASGAGATAASSAAPPAVSANAPSAISIGAPSAQPPKPLPLRSFNNQTIRMVVNTSIAGQSIRVQLSNAFGTGRLKIGAAHVAIRDTSVPAASAATVVETDRALTFSGNATAIIPAGASILSDPVQLAVPAVSDLVISLYLPEDSGPPTQHGTGLHTTLISGPGNFTAQKSITAERTTSSWYFLSSVDLLAPANTRAVVMFGDSITDGATSTVDTNASWPSVLAKRLQAEGITTLAVLNQGISGNRVLRDGAGSNALARFDRDVLAQPGVKYVVLMEGINDIGQGTREGIPADQAVSLEELIAAHKQLIARAHEHGLKIFGATLTPYEGAAYYTATGEAIRSSLNQWIRTSGAYDGVIDFDAVTRDPMNPKHLRLDYNIRDSLHPNDAGYKAMAESIDIRLFR